MSFTVALSISLSFLHSVSIGVDPDLLTLVRFAERGQTLARSLAQKRRDGTFLPAAICANTCEDNALTSIELSGVISGELREELLNCCV